MSYYSSPLKRLKPLFAAEQLEMAIEKSGLPSEVEEVVKKAKYNLRSSKFQLPWPLDVILPSDRATTLYGFIVCAIESTALLFVLVATVIHYTPNLGEYKGEGSPGFTLFVTLVQLVIAFVFEAFFLAGLLKEKHSLCQYQPTAQLAAVCVLLLNGVFALAVDLGGSDDSLHFAIWNPPIIRFLAWFSLIWMIVELYLHSITVPVCRLLKAKNDYGKFVHMNLARYHRKVVFTMAQHAFNQIEMHQSPPPRNKPLNDEVCASTVDSGISSNGGFRYSLPYPEATAANGVMPQPQPSSPPPPAYPETTVNVIIDETLMMAEAETAPSPPKRERTPPPVLVESDSDESRRRFEENMDARGEDTPSIVSPAESDQEEPRTEHKPDEEEAESEEEESSSEEESESSSSSEEEESDDEEKEEEV